MIDRKTDRTGQRRQPAGHRQQAERRGRGAEAFAALSLTLSGWRVVARRHRAHGGEVDLIARRGDLVAMVEVKARRTVQDSVDSVSETAWRRIERAGDDWLMRRHDAARLSVRYDLVAVPTPLRPWRWPKRLAGAWAP